MADRRQKSEILKVLSLCVVWYFVSSSNNVVGKTVLSDFPYPLTVTMVQLLSITLYSGPLFNLWGVRKFFDVSWEYYLKVIIPLALGKCLASVSSHVSIWKVPVSYAHTVKATMPLFTVVLSRVIIGEKQTTKVYLSLIPIIVGVAIATVTEISYDSIGLVSALVATMGFSLQNIFSKKVLHDTGVHHLRLLHVLGKLALVMFLPVWFVVDFRRILNDTETFVSDKSMNIMLLLFVDGLLNWLQNIIAFSVLSLVTPLTYAVANASKRICIITVSLLLLRNPVSSTNVMGMCVAIFGVLYYNKAKYDANQMKKQLTVIPLTQSPAKSTNSLLWEDSRFVSQTPFFHQTNQSYAYSNGFTHPSKAVQNGFHNKGRTHAV